MPQIKAKWEDDNNNPLVGGKIYTYSAGGQTLLNTYTDFTGMTANDNPVILNSRGEANIWLANDIPYKIIVKDSNDVEIYSVDNVTGSGGGGGGTVNLGKVFISALDPVADYLGNKIIAGDNITITTVTNPSGDTISIKADLDGKLLAGATDLTPGFLASKLTSDGSINIVDKGSSIELSVAASNTTTLKDIADASTDTAKSTYKLKSGVDVKFTDSDNNEILTVNEDEIEIAKDFKVTGSSTHASGVIVGDTFEAAEGTIRYHPMSMDIEGYVNGQWVSLTASGDASGTASGVALTGLTTISLTGGYQTPGSYVKIPISSGDLEEGLSINTANDNISVSKEGRYFVAHDGLYYSLSATPASSFLYIKPFVNGVAVGTDTASAGLEIGKHISIAGGFLLDLAEDDILDLRIAWGSSAPVTAGLNIINQKVSILALGGDSSEEEEDTGTTVLMVSQNLHDFSALTPVYYSNGTWEKAKADGDGSTVATHVVTEVIDANTFKVANSGRIEIVGHGLTPDEYYFTSESTAGDSTTTEPTISNPIFKVFDANQIDLFQWRPATSGGSGGGGGTNFLEVSQVGHGFGILNSVYYENGTWLKAIASDGETLGTHIVIEVNGDSFKVANSGRVEVTAHGLTPDEFYFTDATTAGSLTNTEPALSNPMLRVFDDNNIDLFQWRPATGGGSGGASTLNDVGGFSDTAGKSIYEMTSGVSVEFRDDLGNAYFTIRDRALARQLEMKGSVNSQRVRINVEDADNASFSSPLLINDDRTNNNNQLISASTNSDNSLAYLYRGAGTGGSSSAMFQIKDDNSNGARTIVIFPADNAPYALDINSGSGVQHSARFEDGIVVGDTLHPTPMTGAIRYHSASTDLEGFVNGEWVSLTTGATIIQVHNATGSTITKGTPLYVSGGFDNSGEFIASVDLARANAQSTCRNLCVALDDIPDLTIGQAINQGKFDTDLTSFSEGDILFVEATPAGVLTSTEPAYPFLSAKIGRVLEGGVNGTLLVQPDTDPQYSLSGTSNFPPAIQLSNISQVQNSACMLYKVYGADIKPTIDWNGSGAPGSQIWDNGQCEPLVSAGGILRTVSINMAGAAVNESSKASTVFVRLEIWQIRTDSDGDPVKLQNINIPITPKGDINTLNNLGSAKGVSGYKNTSLSIPAGDLFGCVIRASSQFSGGNAYLNAFRNTIVGLSIY